MSTHSNHPSKEIYRGKPELPPIEYYRQGNGVTEITDANYYPLPGTKHRRVHGRPQDRRGL